MRLGAARLMCQKVILAHRDKFNIIDAQLFKEAD
jgi:hypothetical protein